MSKHGSPEGEPKTADDRLIAEAALTIATAVRVRLDAAGHADVAFDQDWVRFEPSSGGGTRPIAKVPLGHGYNLTLQGPDGAGNQREDEMNGAFVDDLAEALPKLRTRARSLERLVRSVAKAVWKLHCDGQTDGRPVITRNIELAPIAAARLAGDDWRDVFQQARVILHLIGYGADLRPEEYLVEVGTAGEVAAALEPILKDQPERKRLFHLARAPGAKLLVDAVTVGLISAAGLDPVEVLRNFSRTWACTITALWNGEERTIYLNSEGIRIRSQMRVCKFWWRVPTTNLTR